MLIINWTVITTIQMIIPTILPLKSYAENNNGYVETSLGKIIYVVISLSLELTQLARQK